MVKKKTKEIFVKLILEMFKNFNNYYYQNQIHNVNTMQI